jgi:hypothetical protein
VLSDGYLAHYFLRKPRRNDFHDRQGAPLVVTKGRKRADALKFEVLIASKMLFLKTDISEGAARYVARRLGKGSAVSKACTIAQASLQKPLHNTLP